MAETEDQIVHLTTVVDETPVEKTTIFTIDDVEYQIDKKPKAVIGLRYLRDLKKVGEQIATANLLTALLGADNFDSLADYDDLTDEDMKAIVTLAQKAVMGELSEAAKN